MKLKDLSKVTGKKSGIDILSCIKVKDNVACATNLENGITMTAFLSDGLYNGPAWAKDRYIQSVDCLPEDFPNLPDIKTAKYTGIFHADKLSAVLPVVCNELKFNIGGFLYSQLSGGEYNAVSTDGHRLHYVGPVDKKVERSFIITKQTGELLSTETEWAMYANEQILFFVCDDVTIAQRVIDQQFPNYKSVIQNHPIVADERLIAFLTEFHLELKKIGASLKNNAILLSVRDGHFFADNILDNQTGFFAVGPDAGGMSEGVLCALNSGYVADIGKIPGPKQVMYQDGESSVHVLTEQGGCLIMPLCDITLQNNITKGTEIKIKPKVEKRVKAKSKPQAIDQSELSALQQEISRLSHIVSELLDENLLLMSKLKTIEEVRL